MKIKIRSKAPLRISFLGGGTDVPPFVNEYGGAVLNVTINKFAHCSVEKDERLLRPIVFEKEYKLQALDLGKSVSYNTLSELKSEELKLLVEALKYFDIKTNMKTYVDVPPGCGLGSSSTLTVAITAALMEYIQAPLNPYNIAETAYKIERERAKIAGGKQDQYAAAFGGFNFMEFNKSKTLVTPIRIRDEVFEEFSERLLVFFTGKSRASANIIEDMQTRMKDGENIDALKRIKELTYEARDALLIGNIDEFGEILDEAWEYKKKYSPMVETQTIKNIYKKAKKNGAIGGKISGAGGGGYMFFITEWGKKPKLVKAMRKLNIINEDISFEKRGVRTWYWTA